MESDSHCDSNQDMPHSTSQHLIESLSAQLDNMYVTARMRRSNMEDASQDSTEYYQSEYFEDLESRLTGRNRSRRTSNSSNSQSATSFKLDIDTAQIYRDLVSPLSPSQTLSQITHAGAVRRNRTSSKTADHQICFGTDSERNLSENKEWHTPTSSPRRRYDSNGNSNVHISADDSGVSSTTTLSSQYLDKLKPTHRATNRFIPRHEDEMLLDIGDPVYVEHEADDLWCTGVNLRTAQRGIFPVSHVFEVDFEDECGSVASLGLKVEEKETFYLTLLGSVEVGHHKGNDVIVQAINKVLYFYKNKSEIVVPNSVLLDVSHRGVHIIDKTQKNLFRCPNFDYFYSLQNLSFCGAHPKQLRYFAFITKHPLLPRFACHVFMSNSSTQAIVDAIGRAFARSYDEYMAFTHPTEDIYLDS